MGGFDVYEGHIVKDRAFLECGRVSVVGRVRQLGDALLIDPLINLPEGDGERIKVVRVGMVIGQGCISLGTGFEKSKTFSDLDALVRPPCGDEGLVGIPSVSGKLSDGTVSIW